MLSNNIDSFELQSRVVFGRTVSGGPPAFFFFIHTIGKTHVSQMTEAAQSAPLFLGAHVKLTHEAQRHLLAQAVRGLRVHGQDGPVTNVRASSHQLRPDFPGAGLPGAGLGKFRHRLIPRHGLVTLRFRNEEGRG